MKAAQINEYGGPEAVEINEDAPVPAMSPDQVLVEVFAAGVNPFDWKLREGYMAEMAPLEFPITLGGDFSGTVRGVGEDVAGFGPGDEVYGQALVLARGSGSFAERAAVDAGHLAGKPKSLTHVEAAALPLTGASAYQVLVEHMKLEKGQKILIHGGAGGIGTFAIQLAKHLGAHVVTTAAAEQEQYVRELGADEIIDYKTQRFEDLVDNCDAVHDTVGGDTYERSFKVLKPGGIIVSMLEQPNEELMSKYSVRAIAQLTRVTNERLVKLAELVDKGVFRTHVDKTFPLELTAEAMSYLQTGRHKGKVVVRIK
jgi:NADPH:quinone reductase-like Zn-dependent oxidoreductase